MGVKDKIFRDIAYEYDQILFLCNPRFLWNLWDFTGLHVTEFT